MEMESTLRKVTKERRGRSFNRHVFIDTLLQGSLSDQQVCAAKSLHTNGLAHYIVAFD